jgi:hypothetical protein
VLAFLQGRQAGGKPLVWLGDLNVCHLDFDVSHPNFFSTQVGWVWVCVRVCVPSSSIKADSTKTKKTPRDALHLTPPKPAHHTCFPHRNNVNNDNITHPPHFTAGPPGHGAAPSEPPRPARVRAHRTRALLADAGGGAFGGRLPRLAPAAL